LKNPLLNEPILTETFDGYAEGSVPDQWEEQNFTTDGTPGSNLDDLTSDSYKGWTIVSRKRLEAIRPSAFRVAPGESLNGQPIASVSEGRLLFAESQSRPGSQVQFVTTRSFHFSHHNAVYVSFGCIYKQSGNSMGAVEYTIDGGKTWKPLVYYLDGDDVKPTGAATFNDPQEDLPRWVEEGLVKGERFADGALARITPATSSLRYCALRSKADDILNNRLEVFEARGTDDQKDVRFRFAQLGKESGYFGIDNLSFYESFHSQLSVRRDRVGNKTTVQISWYGVGALEVADDAKGPWRPALSQLNPQISSPTAATQFFRIRQ
jgi:hypothetical protein